MKVTLEDMSYINGKCNNKLNITKKHHICKICNESEFIGPMTSCVDIDEWIKHYGDKHPFELSVMEYMD